MPTTKTCHIRLPKEIAKRYEDLARHTGRTKAFYMRQAIENHIEDLEDAYVGAVVMERIRRGEEELTPLADWEARRSGQ
ncbi:MAG: TraY domain-containing protein [Planctomycetaceae bacterium]|nr:TraY domain-containing protein [Planctomycetaceae bacterium]